MKCPNLQENKNENKIKVDGKHYGMFCFTIISVAKALDNGLYTLVAEGKANSLSKRSDAQHKSRGFQDEIS